jgi:futalosine hydrolase
VILVVTAVEAEADAVRRGLPAGAPVEVVAVGVGAAAAAAGTAYLLARAAGAASGRSGAESAVKPTRPTSDVPFFTTVVSAGIAGGFVGRIKVGATAVATRSVAADLGADGPDGFLPLDELGFGATSLPTTALGLPGAVPGAILTVSTVTGTAARADALAARLPDAVAEGMEGFGVATACALAGVPFAEVRTVSNAVGPRDRGAWRMREALDALAPVGEFLATLEA